MIVRLRIALIVGLILYLATGLSIVQQDEVGVVRRFGAVQAETWSPGLHWGLPWGLGRLDLVKLDQSRTIAIGAQAAGAAPLARQPDSAEDEFLTGDLNLVTVQAVVQYRVADPVNYLFASTSVESSLRMAAESGLTRALAERGIDDLLTVGRTEAAEVVARSLQTIADREGLGVLVRAVRLGQVAPPVPVAPAFADAARARSDKRQAITLAEEYRDRAQADARGRVRELADRAAADHEGLIQEAQGEADRFTKILRETHDHPGATRQRLYLETMAELLPRLGQKMIVARGQDLDLSLFTDREQPPSTSPVPASRTAGEQ
jgi:membrane protease subunit HflK